MSVKERDAKKIVGAIFPVSHLHFTRFLKDNKTIFVKFTKFNRLKKGLKIIFYISGHKLLFGEGTIAGIEKMDTETAWGLHSQNIFLTREEYDNYVRKSFITNENRKTHYITLFSLRNLKRFQTPLKTTRAVTPAGLYVTKEEYKEMNLK